jgi:dolichol-phosphate hexosyltransferase
MLSAGSGNGSPSSSLRGQPGLPETAKSGIVIVLPTLNEEANLRRTYESLPLAALRARGWSVQSLVIDGGSTDGTVAEAEALGLPVLRQVSRGKGAAIREAMQYAQTKGFQYAIVSDADCTYPGDSVVSLVSLLDSGAQLAVGIRQNHLPADGARAFVHRVGNATLALIASQLSGHVILDLCSGFWGVDLAYWRSEDLVSTGFEIESELFLKSLRSGLSVAQIPIEYRARARGTKLRTVRDGARILLAVLRSVRYPRRADLKGRRSAETLTRAILAACFIQGADRIVVLADLPHLSSAHRISAQLADGGIASTLVVTGQPMPEKSDHLVDALVRRSETYQAPVLALTGKPAGNPTDEETGVMMLPNTRRIIVLGLGGPRVNRSEVRRLLSPGGPAEPAGRSGGFTMVSQRFPGARMSPLRSLQWVVDPSPVEHTVRLLGANPAGLPVSVWKANGRASARATDDGPQR